MSQELFVANSPIKSQDFSVKGEYEKIDGEGFFKIKDYDQMRPFFMTLVSHSDHWLFISSTGGLTAGRKNANTSLFPYYTDDKLTDSFDTTGCKSIFRVKKDNKTFVWEPFSNRYNGLYEIRRNLYKNVIGNKIIFEEINNDLNTSFRYSWQFSEKYGFVRKASLLNIDNNSIEVEFLDGIQNILPYGVDSGLQNERSNLVNAYKKSELESDSGLGLFMLSSIIVDKAEPSEALKSTTVWSSGINSKNRLLSSIQLDNFRNGFQVEPEIDVKAEQSAYFIHESADLAPNEELSWQIVAELNQDHTAVHNLLHFLKTDMGTLLNNLDSDLEDGSHELLKLVGKADGLQITEDNIICARHYTNVLFNIMRGGIFDKGYTIDSEDFKSYAVSVNNKVVSQHQSFFNSLSSNIEYQSLLGLANETGDGDLIRVVLEYLPLTFSRRHGDPSRPWNKFSIETRKEDGSKNLNYQGNWRDIFQNWEALALSYPDFINSMISKFVNASTIDGYNPYRIMRNGIDWEVIEPDDPWSFIGYWGDHQIIYLEKLLEISFSHSKDQLIDLLEQPIFVYANVPYIIKSYEDIVKDPQDTIDFDHEREAIIHERVEDVGADGKMVFDQDNQLLKATLTEKLLVTLLAKLSNFIPEGGIWLNTQRPEWNDANNALVGNGVSMVTLYYMRRYLSFLVELFEQSDTIDFKVNSVVIDLLNSINSCLQDHEKDLGGTFSNTTRKSIMDTLGKAGEAYRDKAYSAFSGASTSNVSKEGLISFFKLARKYMDHSIKANKRPDGLYHSYNLVEIKNDEASIEYLYEMLEGQVSVLSSGTLTGRESIEVLDALKASKIYREDQYSYLLYPDRDLPRFLEKNNIPESFIESSDLAKSLLADGNTMLLTKDVNGGYHFNGAFTNSNSVKEALESLKENGYFQQVQDEYNNYLEVFESIFNHKAFTGRSGTFFGYEGLGSIYWHMVSKLLLAIQEKIFIAIADGEDEKVISQLEEHYYHVRAGIGAHKPPALYGAFPTDPYSHTPAHKGAQQPGMTGQVKEDVMNRWAELGVQVENGKIHFDPKFLKPEEFLTTPNKYKYYNIKDEEETLDLIESELAFTYCQVPVVFKKGSGNGIQVNYSDGTSKDIDGLHLPKEESKEMFSRSGKIVGLKIELN